MYALFPYFCSIGEKRE